MVALVNYSWVDDAALEISILLHACNSRQGVEIYRFSTSKPSVLMWYTRMSAHHSFFYLEDTFSLICLRYCLHEMKSFKLTTVRKFFTFAWWRNSSKRRKNCGMGIKPKREHHYTCSARLTRARIFKEALKPCPKCQSEARDNKWWKLRKLSVEAYEASVSMVFGEEFCCFCHLNARKGKFSRLFLTHNQFSAGGTTDEKIEMFYSFSLEALSMLRLEKVGGTGVYVSYVTLKLVLMSSELKRSFFMI